MLNCRGNGGRMLLRDTTCYYYVRSTSPRRHSARFRPREVSRATGLMHAREGHPSDPIAIHRSLIVLHGWVHDAVRGAERPATHGIHDVTVAFRLLPCQFTHEAETSGEPILHPHPVDTLLEYGTDTAQRTDMVDTFPGHGETHQD